MRLSLPPTSALALICAACASAAVSDKSCLPKVDLGYTIHQALEYNATTEVYKFSNIRFAQAPTGDLRFRAPLDPLVNRSVVENGSRYRACPQGIPLWQANAYIPIAKYSGSAPFSLEAWENDIATSRPPPGLLETTNDKTSEDCLFLDVHVPRRTFRSAGKLGKAKKGAPVLAWIHGGNLVLGSKTGHPTPYMNPDGIIQRAGRIERDGLIFVAINYRLGALGFLAGPEVREDGALNAGLLDQRLALEWIQKNIHRFGGDPDRVTVMGESGGGGSILYHMAAYGGHDGSAPFAQAIAQSPATIPRGVATKGAYEGFLKTLGVKDLAEARKMNEKDVIQANQMQIGAAPPTTSLWVPVVDGQMIPGEIGDMFYSGAFDHTVKVMTSHNSFEGGFFYNPNVTTEDDFRAWIPQSLAGITSEDVEHLATVLYPPRFDGALGYVDQATRQMALFGEAIIDCTFLLANQVLNGTSYAYQFNVSPGLHIQDLKYTFDDYTTSVRGPAAKHVLQQSLASFAVKGRPSLDDTSGIRSFPRWGTEQKLLNISASGAEISTSRVNETRCAWWHKSG